MGFFMRFSSSRATIVPTSIHRNGDRISSRIVKWGNDTYRIYNKVGSMHVPQPCIFRTPVGSSVAMYSQRNHVSPFRPQFFSSGVMTAPAFNNPTFAELCEGLDRTGAGCTTLNEGSGLRALPGEDLDVVSAWPVPSVLRLPSFELPGEPLFVDAWSESFA